MQKLLFSKTLLFFCFFVLAFEFNSFGQTWLWDKTIFPLASNKIAYSIRTTTDLNNNIYAAGSWKSDSIKIGSKTYNNYHPGTNNYETYLVKYDANGNIKWSSASIVGQAYPYDVVTDKTGCVYLYGGFWTDSVQFGTHLMINSHIDSCYPAWCSWGAGTYFIIKYDSSGNIIWTKIGDNVRSGGTIAIDEAANLYISGTYWNSTMKIGPFTLYNTNYHYMEIFIAKYDSSGNEQFAKSFGNIGDDNAGGISCSNNRLYLAGNFKSPTLSFGSTTLNFKTSATYDTFMNGFLIQLDTSGNPKWAKSVAGDVSPWVMTTDRTGSTYIAGKILGSAAYAAFDADTLKGSTIPYAGFLAKYDSTGNVLWAKSIHNKTTALTSLSGLPQGNSVLAITTDPCNNVWISGQISGDTTGFFIDSSIILKAPAYKANYWPMYFAGYDLNGKIIYSTAIKYGTGGAAGPYDLSSDKNGNIILGSGFSGFAGIKGDTLILGDTIILHSESAPILAKLGRNCNDIDPLGVFYNNAGIDNIDDFSIYPNPANTALTISAHQTISSVYITNLLGQTVHDRSYNRSQVQIDVSDLRAGIYIIKISGSGIKKFVKE